MTSCRNSSVSIALVSLFAPLVPFVLLFILGCGSKFGAEVRGVVSNDGQPLPLGTVAFHPVASGTPAYGTIQADGSYTVRTGSQPGLPPGEYIVTVVAREPNTQRSEGGGPPEPGKLLTSSKYTEKNTSGLRITVTKGRNDFPIDLISE